MVCLSKSANPPPPPPQTHRHRHTSSYILTSVFLRCHFVIFKDHDSGEVPDAVLVPQCLVLVHINTTHLDNTLWEGKGEGVGQRGGAVRWECSNAV